MLKDKERCKSCIHYQVCLSWLIDFNVNVALMSSCDNYEPQDLEDTSSPPKSVWVKHSPDLKMMEEFHDIGIGKGMSVNSIFWTCSNCGIWGTPIYRYCPHCGSKMQNQKE